MRVPDYTLRFTEPVICVKPGRTLLLRLSILLLAVVGIPAVGVLIWAEVTGFNLNHLPWLPRIALAGVAVACAFGIYSSVREAQVPVQLSCFRDRLLLRYEGRPSLWSAEAADREIEVAFSDVKQCIFSRSRLRMTLDTRGYRLRIGAGDWVRNTGVVRFSTLGAPDTDFASLVQKHTPLKVIVKQ